MGDHSNETRLRRQGRLRQDHAWPRCSRAAPPRSATRSWPSTPTSTSTWPPHSARRRRSRRDARPRRAPGRHQGLPAREQPAHPVRRPHAQDHAARARLAPAHRRGVRTRSSTRSSPRTSGIRFAATGGFVDDDLGVACYHSKVGAVELLLNHLIDGTDEYVGRRHGRRRRSLRLRHVHPLRPHLPGVRTDPAQRRRLQAVHRLRRGLRREDRRDRQQDRRRGRRRVPARARRRRAHRLVLGAPSTSRPPNAAASAPSTPSNPRTSPSSTPPANGPSIPARTGPNSPAKPTTSTARPRWPGATTAPGWTWPTRSRRTTSSERTCSERRPSGTSRAPHSAVRPVWTVLIGDSSASISRQRRVTGAEHNEPIRTERRTHVP